MFCYIFIKATNNNVSIEREKMADFVFNKCKEYMSDGTIDMDRTTSDSFKIALYTDASLPAATITNKATLDASYTEVASGSGYTTGGESLTSITWSESAGTVTWDADNVQWTSATFTARYAIIYADYVTTPVADPLMILLDFGSNQSVINGTFTVPFNASGILTAV
jgi:hypothetical protein